MPTLSIIMITKNSERTLRQCLDALLPIMDELIILDSGSTDNTVTIAKQYTDQVFETDWPGFGEQKQRALERATGDWVFSIDDDEICTPLLVNEIKSAIASNQYDGFYFKRYLVFGGRVMKHCDASPQVLRLFRRGKARFTDDVVHEGLIFEGKADRLSGYMYHYSYQDVNDWMNRMNYYTTLSVQIKKKKGQQSSITKAVLSSVFTFFKFYIMKRGFLDGRMGFVVATNWASGNYYKYLKLAIDESFQDPEKVGSSL